MVTKVQGVLTMTIIIGGVLTMTLRVPLTTVKKMMMGVTMMGNTPMMLGVRMAKCPRILI